MTMEGEIASLKDQLAEYQVENALLIAALQKIADGQGKYARVAQEALGQR